MPAKKKAASAVSKTTKKTTASSSSSRNVQAIDRVSDDNNEEVGSSSRLRFRRSYVLLVLGVLLIAGLIYYYRSAFIVAMVNGQPISRLSYYQELEKQGGKQVLDTLVTKTLIFQEAKKKDVRVTEEELDKEIKKIEDNLKSQGQQLDQILLFQGLTRPGLREQIRLQKLAEKMAAPDVKISDKEIEDYITQNKETLGENASSKESQDKATSAIREQKVNDAIRIWLEKLQKDAKITRFVE